MHPHVASASPAFLRDNLSLVFGVLGNVSAASLLRRQPGLLLAPLTAWCSFLTACGMPEQQFGQLLASAPAIFLQGSIYNAGRAMAVLRTLGLSDAHLCSRIPLRYPQLLLADVDTSLQPAADLLHTLRLPPATLAQIATRAPHLLTRPPAAAMAPALRHLRALPVPPAALPPLLAAHPGVLAMAPAAIDARLAFFASLGLPRDAAVSVLLSCPEALALTRGNLERKWRYLREEVGGGLEAVLRYPRYFAAGLQVDIGPRFLFVQQHPRLRERLWQEVCGAGAARQADSECRGGGSGGGGVEGGGAGGGGFHSTGVGSSSSGGVDGAPCSSESGTAGLGVGMAAGRSIGIGGSSSSSSGGGGGGSSGSTATLCDTSSSGNERMVDLEWLLATPVPDLVGLVGESVAVYEEHAAACQHDLAVQWGAGSAGRAVA